MVFNQHSLCKNMPKGANVREMCDAKINVL